jgi:hypothetical protein
VIDRREEFPLGCLFFEVYILDPGSSPFQMRGSIIDYILQEIHKVVASMCLLNHVVNLLAYICNLFEIERIQVR